MDLDKTSEHRLAADLFNHVWELLESKDRTPEQDEEMIHAAHASRYHWGKVGEGVQFGRGEWQLSRVYATLGRPESARAHAQRYLELCDQHQLGAFDRGFAHEAAARAEAVGGNHQEAKRQIGLGRSAATAVDDVEDRDWLVKNLNEVEAMIGGGR